MLRILLWAVLLFLAVRIIGRIFAPRRPPAARTDGPASGGVLVQDPVCGAFVERSRALVARGPGGEESYFCSESCRRRAAEKAL